ncbi:hypothetical protein Syn7803C97_103 [Synechococcus phage S-MbCM6]|jgi:hypothetical protein|uniref:Gp130 n=3 Tax=Namakavirus smbcm6 TaxID=2734120 RepID=V5UUC3_9CAUD|nr:hypothetical protein S-MbCM25_104 [Synechococcus phage S-MbCM25]AIX14499.1 hypothetical protein Syn7803C43_104 [Synechococcus phage ACG-2014c]AIX22656.1 hypothetical protein Syn7803C97_103 [Synechococcus phage ACG-2014c]AIX22871.1 hypothetical protein Syn7803C98_103 [Synechococcus phage ACG-2014c]AIX38104.1 hypothetical protein Syn7803US88_103 [Synechococcus phage ACG-2014c]
MPSDAALEIVNKIFGDEKAKAIDITNDALAATTYDRIQQQKINFAKTMGFDLGDTAQDAADEVSDNLPDNTDSPEEVEVDARMPEDDTPEETEETLETDETDS